MGFDEDPVRDSSGSGNAGAIAEANNPDYTTGGKFGGGYSFIENDDSHIGGAPMIDYDSSSGAFSTWINVIETSGNRFIFYAYDGDGNNRISLSFESTTGMRLLKYGGGTNGTELGSIDYADGTWHNFIVNWDGSNAWLYVDGNTTAELTIAGGAGTEITWYVGGDYGGNQSPTGVMDEVAIFNRPLSPAEINHIYHRNPRSQ